MRGGDTLVAKEAQPQPKPQQKDKPKGPAPAKKTAAQAVVKPGITVSDGKEVAHPVPRLKKLYKETVVPDMMARHGLENPMAVPSLSKIVINIGVSDAKDNIQLLDSAREELALIAGQWPQLRRAKKSISNFKLRQGVPIGLRVTLRGDRMYEFLDRLIATAIPRIRDFRGLAPKGFDGRGNFNLGLKEQLIFPEINVEKVAKQRGMNISIVTTAETDEMSFDFLKSLGMPFRKEGKAPGQSVKA
ncbi:MAG: 50S ribosomal protein L5 [Elusimicrobia bacterium]|nr:50S ribosomal protein L5 [Elusimicrobiota bacterium]